MISVNQEATKNLETSLKLSLGQHPLEEVLRLGKVDLCPECGEALFIYPEVDMNGILIGEIAVCKGCGLSQST